ncbi:MAG TPA: radical SAM protein [Verrucomicrobiae bacterium]|nr:radical SAM protein [Verrucomicrobiae bacterium]
MKIRFIFPKWQKLLDQDEDLSRTLAGYEIGNFRMPGLAVPSVAAATPHDCQIELVDEHTQSLDFDNLDFDLAAISFFTPQASRAYEIAIQIRKRGKKVVFGGLHPTLLPFEAMKHADAVCAGMAEPCWTDIITDFKHNRLKPLYDTRSAVPYSSQYHTPVRSLWQKKGYVQIGVVQISRGCTYRCPYCVVPPYAGDDIVYRPLDDVVAEIAALDYPSFYVADENLIFSSARDSQYASALLRQIAHLKKRLFIASFPFLINRAADNIMELLANAGCTQIYLVTGLDSESEKMYAGDTTAVDQAVKKIRSFGIPVMTSFCVGSDLFEEKHFSWLIDYSDSLETDLAEFFISTPYPGTSVRARLAGERRLLDVPWSKYNGANVTYRPARISERELAHGFRNLWLKYYGRLSRFEAYKRITRCFGASVLKTFERKATG